MQRGIVWITIILVSSLGTAWAGPFSFNVETDVYAVEQGGTVNGIPTARDNNDGAPDLYDAANLLYGLAGLGAPFARNFHLDPLFVSADEVWRELGNGTVALIGLTAGNTNTIGVYTDLGVGNDRTDVLGPFSGFGFEGDGTAGNPFPAGLTGLTLGQHYGWFLNSDGTRYFSEPGLNPEGIDHLMTFNMSALAGLTVFVDMGFGPTPFTLGSQTFLLGWEDLPFANGVAGDDDYDDMIYLITNVPRTTTPEPSLLLLLGLGLASLGMVNRRNS